MQHMSNKPDWDPTPQLYGHSQRWKILVLVPGPKREPLPKAISGQFWLGTDTYSCLRPWNERPRLQEPPSHHICLQTFVIALSHLGFSLSVTTCQENKHRNIFLLSDHLLLTVLMNYRLFMTAFAHQVFLPSMDPSHRPETRQQSIILIVDHSLGGVSVEIL